MDKPPMERLPDSDDSPMLDSGQRSVLWLCAPWIASMRRFSVHGARSLCETDESCILMELLMNDESLHG
jgi:hypothetical protein